MRERNGHPLFKHMATSHGEADFKRLSKEFYE